ncbi:MAG: hypothetical protein IPO92_01530 [Saprospiraceae bacterium]|nr:hypothetical protein [Saprospiraceae bacterium]
MKYYFIMLIFCFSSCLLAQESNQKIEDIDIEKFVTILIESKSTKINYDSIIIRTLFETGISQERYGQILRSSLEGKKLSITKMEQDGMAKINKKDNSIKIVKNQILLTLCEEKSFSIIKYNYIMEKMKSDVFLRDSIISLISKYKDNK